MEKNVSECQLAAQKMYSDNMQADRIGDQKKLIAERDLKIAELVAALDAKTTMYEKKNEELFKLSREVGEHKARADTLQLSLDREKLLAAQYYDMSERLRTDMKDICEPSHTCHL